MDDGGAHKASVPQEGQLMAVEEEVSLSSVMQPLLTALVPVNNLPHLL